MDFLTIDKKANCYTIEIGCDYKVRESESEIFFYKTVEELKAAVPEVIDRAIAKAAEEKAILDKKEERK